MGFQEIAERHNKVNASKCITSREEYGKEQKRMKFLVIANHDNPQTTDMFYQLAAYFTSLGFAYEVRDVTDLPSAAFVFDAEPADLEQHYGKDYDLIITLGGDGTIIHTARLAYMMDIPILGINMGHLGFLANTVDNNVIKLIADALSDELIREQRMTLKIEVHCFGEGETEKTYEISEDGLRPNVKPSRTFFAINEIAIARGSLGHMVDYTFSISGDKIASMRGDGLIVSTATGSTAYALSAGGPLVGCNLRGMIVVPLAPHTLNSRAIVTEYQDVVEVDFEEGSISSREVELFIDGDAIAFDKPISSVVVSVNSQPIILLNRHRESFYKQISRTFFK